jgi:hypothetical protein
MTGGGKTDSKEELFDKIEEIGTIKRNLSFKDRALTSGYGLYVQSGRLSRGAMQYMAGGKLAKKLVFVRETTGSRTVKKYQPGDWESKVEDTLSLCRALERASKGQTGWTQEKLEAYWAEEASDSAILDRVDRSWQEHSNQLKNVWDTASEEQRRMLISILFKELEEEWPTEFLEVTSGRVSDATGERMMKGIQKAYLIGFMVGKGWIAKEEATETYLYLGDETALNIRRVLKGAKSRGTAFASAFACVATRGTMLALASGE